MITTDEAITTTIKDIRKIEAEETLINPKHQRNKTDDVQLSKRWGVSREIATRTRKVTTQRGIRFLKGNLERRFRTRQKQLERPLLGTNVYGDTMFAQSTSIRGKTCAELFVTSEGVLNGMTMKSKSEAYLALEKLCREDGIPRTLITDRAKEELYGEWGNIVKRNLIDQRTTEPHSG